MKRNPMHLLYILAVMFAIGCQPKPEAVTPAYRIYGSEPLSPTRQAPRTTAASAVQVTVTRPQLAP